MPGDYSAIFPYEARPIQESIMQSMWAVLGKGGHIVIEAGTGAGKTVSILAPALLYCYLHGKRLLYLTRTNSQQKQVITEFRRVRKRAEGSVGEEVGPPESTSQDALQRILKELNSGGGHRQKRPSEEERDRGPPNKGGVWDGGLGCGSCVGLQGRSNMCPVTEEDPAMIMGTSEELSRMCAERKRNTINRMSGKPTGGKECRHYAAFLLDEGLEVRRWARRSNPTAEELIHRCLSIGVCPYEVTKMRVGESVLVSSPYIYFISPFIRHRLLDWMGCSLDDLVVIVDEAHNLAPYARDLSTLSLTQNTIRLALLEVEKFGDHTVGKGTTIKTFLEKMAAVVDSIAQEYLIDEDGLIPPTALGEQMMILLRTTSREIESMSGQLMHHGAAIQERRKAEGKLPRSYIHSVGLFYLKWQELDFESYTPLVVLDKRAENASIEAYSMDPSVLTAVLKDVHATAHLSGTLSPLEEYRDTIGLPGDAELLSLPPPFPPGNRKVAYFTDLTTNHETLSRDPDMVERYRTRISDLLSRSCGVNTAVFFPSFKLLNRILGSEELEDGNSLPPSLSPGRRMFVEGRPTSQSDLMDLVDDFRAGLAHVGHPPDDRQLPLGRQTADDVGGLGGRNV